MRPAETEIAGFADDVDRFARDCVAGAAEPAVRQAMVARLVDTVGCLRGAMNEEVVVKARQTALAFSSVALSAKGATVAGSAERLTVEAAAFVNCVAARYLDFNDIYLSKEAVHPSDNIPAGLALGYEVQTQKTPVIRGSHARWN